MFTNFTKATLASLFLSTSALAAPVCGLVTEVKVTAVSDPIGSDSGKIDFAIDGKKFGYKPAWTSHDGYIRFTDPLVAAVSTILSNAYWNAKPVCWDQAAGTLTLSK
jgi:hypothetical protein